VLQAKQCGRAHHNRFLLSAPKPSDWVKTSQLAKKEK
jgi:hypothetical protein